MLSLWWSNDSVQTLSWKIGTTSGYETGPLGPGQTYSREFTSDIESWGWELSGFTGSVSSPAAPLPGYQAMLIASD